MPDNEISEIRFGLDKPVLISNGVTTAFFTDEQGKKIISGREMFDYMLEKLTGGSLYSVNNNIKEGFVTVKGGHRVGLCGTAVLQNGSISHIKNISGLCFRISREVKGCALSLINELKENGSLCSILIASPPGCGKTTIIRDLCRIIANGELSLGIKNVGLADERGEIACINDGCPSFDVGAGTFVCDGYTKSQAMMIMLRCMAPDVLICDEIGDKKDFEAVNMALKSGVSVIATAHAGDINDLTQKFGSEVKYFDKIVFLMSKGKIKKIYRRSKGDY